MKPRLKSCFLILLLLFIALLLVACAPSMSSIEQRLEELEEADQLSYQRTPKSQRDDLIEDLDDDYDLKLSGGIPKIYVAEVYNEDRTEYKSVTVIEFEKAADAKSVEKALTDTLGEGLVLTRKGKLLLMGNAAMIDLILD